MRWARTPVVEFVKSNDVLQIDKLYKYFLSDWAGPFAKLDLLTSILPTERVTEGNQGDARRSALQGVDFAERGL